MRKVFGFGHLSIKSRLFNESMDFEAATMDIVGWESPPRVVRSRRHVHRVLGPLPFPTVTVFVRALWPGDDEGIRAIVRNPMMHTEFSATVCAGFDDNDIEIAMDTCLFSPSQPSSHGDLGLQFTWYCKDDEALLRVLNLEA